MTWKEWQKWFNSKHWALKWFVVLILIRPLVDSFYFLKEISPLLSPLYIVGVLSPVLIIWSLGRLKRPAYSQLDSTFKLFTFFAGIGIAFVVFYAPLSREALEMTLKLSLPFFLYFYLRRFIRTQQDLDGLLQTFLYSGVFVAMVLIYELAFGAIRVEESRGFERLQGNFGDVVSYGIYIVFCFLIVTYFYFSRKQKVNRQNRILLIVFVSMLCLLGLVNMYHVASWIIFLSLVGLFFMFNFRNNYSGALLMVLAGIALFLVFGQELFNERILPLLSTDQRVFEGDLGVDRLAHGRVGRWKWMLDLYTRQNVIIQFFGFPITMDRPYPFVGSGAHNDYMRILFLSGYAGLLTYLAVLVQVYRRAMKTVFAVQYLGIGALLILMLFSVSITPTYYPHFMYITMAIIAFLALPQSQVKGR